MRPPPQALKTSGWWLSVNLRFWSKFKRSEAGFDLNISFRARDCLHRPCKARARDFECPSGFEPNATIVVCRIACWVNFYPQMWAHASGSRSGTSKVARSRVRRRFGGWNKNRAKHIAHAEHENRGCGSKIARVSISLFSRVPLRSDRCRQHFRNQHFMLNVFKVTWVFVFEIPPVL